MNANVPTDWNFPAPPPNANVLFHSGLEYLDKQGVVKDPDNLWNLFRQVTEGAIVDPDDFAAVLNLKGVGVAKLTQTLSLINGADFLSLANNFPVLPLPQNPDLATVVRRGYIEYQTFLNEIRKRFPECKMFEINLLGLLLGKEKWFPIRRQFWIVSSNVYDDGDNYTSSFQNENAVWVGGPGGGAIVYRLSEPQPGDIVLVRFGKSYFHGIAIVLDNGYATGFTSNAVIKVLWLNKKQVSTVPDVGNSTGFRIANEGTWKHFKTIYPETFQFLDQLPIPSSSNNLITMTKIDSAFNTILYGPPGTGKTYNSIEKAVRIVHPEFFSQKQQRKDVKEEFDRLNAAGQIEFITFHQSLGYEDFIEGIKPLAPDEDEDTDKIGLTYGVVDGIFKRLCTEAAYTFVETDHTSEAGQVLEFSDAYDRLVVKALEARDAGMPLHIPTRTDADMIIEDVSRHNNLRIRHDGGSRTYGVSKARLGRIAQAFPDLDALANIHDQFRNVIGGSNATAYYAVLREIRNLRGEVEDVPVEKEYNYEEKVAAVKKLTQKDFEKTASKRFVLIIDEINRGNVSSIFGELVTLLEEDKRLGKDEALRAKLPYSGEDFGVPPNLYVIGTMNTADRSVEALDTALRRRFAFVHKPPQYDGLSEDCEGVNLKLLLAMINRRLTILIDADHTIGHAWLWNVATLEELQSKFKTKILPLLQEYFYNDYAKLGLVLGDHFFNVEVKTGDDDLAKFTLNENEMEDYSGSIILNLKDTTTLSIADFQSIYTKK